MPPTSPNANRHRGSKRVYVAQFAHESNTFAAEPTTERDFERNGVYRGEAIPEYYRDTETELAGVVEGAEESGIDLVFGIAAEATPGGVVSREAYDRYSTAIAEAARDAPGVDGVLLALHGAMVAEGVPDPEGTLLGRLGDVLGATPIAITLDLHGNVSEAMVDAADVLVSYETHPHLDKREAGRTAVGLLRRAMDGDDFATWMARPPILPHSPFQNTFEGPMADVSERARELETRDGVCKVNVLPGFHRADVPDMGFSVPVVGETEAAARDAARDVAAHVWERRREFVGEYPEPPEAAARTAELIAAGETEDGPIVLADFGPQPGGGGAADGTATLGELIAQGVTNAGYAIMRDPEAVDRCVDAGVGERVSLPLGGKTDDRHGEPLDVDGHVKAITDGTFVNTGTSHRGTGVEMNMGRTVRLQCGPADGVAVIVCEERAPPFDREVWRHVGITPERTDALVVTSTTAFRGDYEAVASHVIEVDSPGVASPIPERFDYQRVRRPQFPLDEMADDAYLDWE